MVVEHQDYLLLYVLMQLTRLQKGMTEYPDSFRMELVMETRVLESYHSVHGDVMTHSAVNIEIDPVSSTHPDRPKTIQKIDASLIIENN